ncbi:MAG: hypothetical protein NVS2B5_24090 [Beijerinckiaceae bacterium]
MLRLVLQISLVAFVLAAIGPRAVIDSLQNAIEFVAEAKWPPVAPLGSDEARPWLDPAPRAPVTRGRNFFAQNAPPAKPLGPGRVQIAADRSGHYRT